MDPFSGAADGARPYSQHKNQLLRQQAAMLATQNGLLPESVIWTYVIQLTSALRHIHSNALACRNSVDRFLDVWRFGGYFSRNCLPYGFPLINAVILALISSP